MPFEITGKLHVVFDEQQVSASFRKREFVLEVQDGKYQEYPKFQLTQDKCSLLDNFRVGEEVKVTFNLSGRPFEKNGVTTYFTNLSAWRIDSAQGGQQPAQAAPSYGAKPAAANSNSYSAPAAMGIGSDADDELPF